MKRILLLVTLMVPALVMAAGVGYRIVHPDGTVEFTDDHLRGGEAVELREAPSIPAFSTPPTSLARPEVQTTKPAKVYQLLQIASPQHDEVVWFDGSGVRVSLALQPHLRQQDSIVIEMNGERIAEGRSNSINIPIVYRGSHEIQAIVLDRNGREIQRSDSITFHLRQHSVR